MKMSPYTIFIVLMQFSTFFAEHQIRNFLLETFYQIRHFTKFLFE